MTMAEAAFGFTEEEWFQALRLAGPEDEAREVAAELARPDDEDMDFAMSTETLALLSITSESARLKAERIRKEHQTALHSSWVQEQTRAGPMSDEELARRWTAHLKADDETWEALRQSIRRSLQEEGRLPRDS